jgi:hypothetical protein
MAQFSQNCQLVCHSIPYTDGSFFHCTVNSAVCVRVSLLSWFAELHIEHVYSAFNENNDLYDYASGLMSDGSISHRDLVIEEKNELT